VLEYVRVAQDIEEQVATGELRPGDKLPAETALADHYGVAVNTVRRAMVELRKRGLIESVWGKGTFITEGPA
jgi:GntR family transcriptional regulator